MQDGLYALSAYTLEICDDRTATTRVDLELAPCGLFVESEGVCAAFCRNLADDVSGPTDEQIRHAAELLSGGRDEESVERLVATFREAIEQGPPPVFPERAFFILEAPQ